MRFTRRVSWAGVAAVAMIFGISVGAQQAVVSQQTANPVSGDWPLYRHDLRHRLLPSHADYGPERDPPHSGMDLSLPRRRTGGCRETSAHRALGPFDRKARL